MYYRRLYVTDGGLISYGPDFTDQFRRAASYVDRILKGEKPADLPVQAPTKYELVAAKQVGLLRDLVPAARLIGFLVNPRNPITERNVRDALDAAQKLGEKIEIVHASSEAEIDAAFDTLRGMRASALLVQGDAFLINERIVALAARDALPAMYQTRELVAAGGLMSYGPSVADMYRQMGVYAGKVLKGANPAEMPVLQPTKFEMAINLKTANALGLKLSDNLLSLADEVIE